MAFFFRSKSWITDKQSIYHKQMSLPCGSSIKFISLVFIDDPWWYFTITFFFQVNPLRGSLHTSSTWWHTTTSSRLLRVAIKLNPQNTAKYATNILQRVTSITIGKFILVTNRSTYVWGGLKGVRFWVSMGNFMFYRLSATSHCLLGVFRFSTAFQKCFPVSAVLKYNFLFSADIFKFSVTQKCNFPVSGTLLSSVFLCRVFSLFPVFRQFLLCFSACPP